MTTINGVNVDNNDLSFLDDQRNGAIQFKNVLFLVLRNIHWFVLFAIIGAFVAAYYVHMQSRVYESHAQIVVKDPNSNSIDMRDSELLNSVTGARTGKFYVTTLNNEITILKSKTTMMEVVRQLNMNTTYTVPTKIVKRVTDLYDTTPVLVNFLDLDEKAFANLAVTPVNGTEVIIDGEGESSQSAVFGDTVMTSVGRIVVQPTRHYTTGWLNRTVFVTRKSIASTCDEYRQKLIVARDDEKNTIVNISIRDISAQRAADVINTLIDVYNNDAVESKKKIVAYSYDYINDRLAVLDKELSGKEDELATFKRQNQLLDVDQLGQAYLTASEESKRREVEIEQQLSMTGYLRQALDAGEVNKPLPVIVGMEDQNISKNIVLYNDNAMKLGRYELSSATNNPVVKELITDQKALMENLQKMIGAYEDILQSSLKSAQQSNASAADKIRSVPMQQIYVGNVERMQKIKEQLYLNLLTKREELMISQPSMEGSAKVIEEARVNPVHVSPNENKAITTGALLGLFLPVLFFFLLRLLDTKVRYRADVEKNTKVPFLGEIPALDKKDGRHVVVAINSRDAVSEAFRILRPNLEYMFDQSSNSTVMLFTSFFESSGKSFITTNLAATFALAGKRVILLDLDLRKGTLNKNMGSERYAGMSNYLAAKVNSIDDIIKHDIVAPGVDCIFSGPLPPNPAELFSNSRFDELIAELRKRYQFILLDSVPVGLVADVDIVKRVADTTAFVIRARSFDKGMLIDLDSIYKDGKLPKMGIILNDVKYPRNGGYGYGKGYGYSYGYGNGYGYGYGYGYGAGYGYGSSSSTKSNYLYGANDGKHKKRLGKKLMDNVKVGSINLFRKIKSFVSSRLQRGRREHSELSDRPTNGKVPKESQKH